MGKWKADVKINMKILVSDSWMKCFGFMRNRKQFISTEIYPLITNKKKKQVVKITARF